MTVKRYSFFAHFNRVNMQRKLAQVWTVHFRGTCYQVESIKFKVPTTTRFVPEGRQPRATMRGLASTVTVSNGQAVVQ
jgi:hypothetical protein